MILNIFKKKRKKIPFLIIPKNSGIKAIHNKWGIIIVANEDSVEKIRFLGMFDADDFGIDFGKGIHEEK